MIILCPSSKMCSVSAQKYTIAGYIKVFDSNTITNDSHGLPHGLPISLNLFKGEALNLCARTQKVGAHTPGIFFHFFNSVFGGVPVSTKSGS